jgi:hypothetical protein
MSVCGFRTERADLSFPEGTVVMAGIPETGTRAQSAADEGTVDVRLPASTARALLGSLVSRSLPATNVILDVQAALARALGGSGGGKNGKGKGKGGGGKSALASRRRG